MKDNLIIILSVLCVFLLGTTIFNWVMWQDCYNYIDELENNNKTLKKEKYDLETENKQLEQRLNDELFENNWLEDFYASYVCQEDWCEVHE